jgi:hypothetical protein
MNELTIRRETLPATGEAKMLAREMAAAYRDRVLRHKHELGLSSEEAAAKADEPPSLSETIRITDRAPDELTWEDLQALVGQTGGRSVDRWDEVKRAAREELRSGDRAGAVLQGRQPHPFQLARFLALREDLADGWQPRNGIERQLIDQMAQAQVMMSLWLERLSPDDAVADPDGADKVGAMADRFQKMFLRTLRALQDLRKVPLAVLVQNVGGQVNVGQQQVNVAPQAGGRNGTPLPRAKGRHRSGRPAPCTCAADRGVFIGESR